MRYLNKMTVACTALLAMFLANTAGAEPVKYSRDQSWLPIPEVSPPYWEMNGAAVDRAGTRVYATRRFEPPIIEIDGSTGKILREFGTGLLVWPHGIFVDHEGFIWAADATVGDPPYLGLMGPIPNTVKAGRGHQVFKLSPDGKVVMTLGTKGVAGTDSTHFNAPTAVVVDPVDGDIFVSDGHNARTNARVVKFSKDGKFIKAWGKLGSAPGEFNTPHAIALDSQGRVFVADRGNRRIQIFDQDGGFIAQWPQFGAPSGIAITPDDMMFVTSGRIITIGSAKDGTVYGTMGGVRAEGIATDAHGNIYASEVFDRSVKKFVRDH
ncbi:MAG: 6-bladed beta-propeller [Gammaproteobacteria bacterium]|nr:6-bladed beta-propeller [Gammaproteobacteria bacterium]